MKVYRRNERLITAAPEPIAGLIADFGRIWPTQLSPAPRRQADRLYDAGPMVWEEFDRPGAARAFRVVSPDQVQVEHWFELEPADGATVLRHIVNGSVAREYEATWSERIFADHDTVVEALFDNVQAAVASGN
jgi:hypothetical protein